MNLNLINVDLIFPSWINKINTSYILKETDKSNERKRNVHHRHPNTYLEVDISEGECLVICRTVAKSIVWTQDLGAKHQI